MAELLETQQGRCFYCGCPLQELVEIKGRVRSSGLHWDHVVPWNYCRRNDDSNFVASCQICNGIKSDKVFEQIDEARYYVRQERIRRELPLFELPKPVHQEKEVAKVLQSELPNGALVEKSPSRPFRPAKTRIGYVNGEYAAIPEITPTIDPHPPCQDSS